MYEMGAMYEINLKLNYKRYLCSSPQLIKPQVGNKNGLAKIRPLTYKKKKNATSQLSNAVL